MSRFVNSGNYQFDQRQLQSILQLLELPNLDSIARNRLNTTIAVHYETNNQYEAAFSHFQAAAEVIHTHYTHRGFQFANEKRSEVVEDLQTFFQRPVFESYNDAGNSSQTPVFIVGMPRSGTTLLQQILAKHPAIFAAGELSLMNDLICHKFGNATQTRLKDVLPNTDADWVQSTAACYLKNLD